MRRFLEWLSVKKLTGGNARTREIGSVVLHYFHPHLRKGFAAVMEFDTRNAGQLELQIHRKNAGVKSAPSGAQVCVVMRNSKIQWCDDTVNIVMGCDGCELWPTFSKITGDIASRVVRFTGLPEERVRIDVRNVAEQYRDHETLEIIRNTMRDIAATYGSRLSAVDVQEIVSQVSTQRKCYAGVMTARFAGRNNGYPSRFELPTQYPGRSEKAASARDLAGTGRPDKPWLNGLPRTIFVSDMGDALSASVPFEYLQRELVDVALSENGRQHRWLWLTKRPQRMAEFSRWLLCRDIEWPENVMAMTSVTSQRTVNRVEALRQVDCRMRGLSVEPLWTPVTLPLDGIDWVIVGGESGRGAEPFHLEWITDIRAQCERAGVALFVKQLGAQPIRDGVPLDLCDSHGGDWDEWSEELRIREMPDCFRATTLAA